MQVRTMTLPYFVFFPSRLAKLIYDTKCVGNERRYSQKLLCGRNNGPFNCLMCFFSRIQLTRILTRMERTPLVWLYCLLGNPLGLSKQNQNKYPFQTFRSMWITLYWMWLSLELLLTRVIISVDLDDMYKLLCACNYKLHLLHSGGL